MKRLLARLLFRSLARSRAILLALLFWTQAAAAAPLWHAATLPADGAIAGAAGSTIGWGYEIGNDDATRWLVFTGLGADVFEHGSPAALFDLPVLAPGASLARAYDGFSGLYALAWDASAPRHFLNAGSFVLTAEWWDGDPLSGGAFNAPADTLRLDYSATVSSAVPEPATAALLLAGGLALLA